jgi:hypothetical protein
LVCAHVEVLLDRMEAVALVVEQLADDLLADVEILLHQGLADLPGREFGPEDLPAHRVARGMVLQDGMETRHQVR